MEHNTVVLAFSGGLDTSFCVPWLKERGFEVVTLLVDTGGFSPAECRAIEARARELGAADHVQADGAQQIWDHFVVPFVMGGVPYQDQYPLLCSDRYVIVQRSLALCDKLGTRRFAHGCTAMGNDQVRFDQSVFSLGDYEILAPIREIQREHSAVRVYEQEYLQQRGFSVAPKTSKYSINQNLLGVTTSGSEIDQFQAPGPETWVLCKPRAQWPAEPLSLRIEFDRGVAVALDGVRMEGPALLRKLNDVFGAYGVGRGLYVGDTTIGLKGRIVFECPGLTALLVAHRALSEAVLTRSQNQFLPQVARQWTELVYRGFFFEPLKDDLEAYLRSAQRWVSGTVTLGSTGGVCVAEALASPHVLQRKGAVYAQSSDWTPEQAEGFIRLFGQSTTLHAMLHGPKVQPPDR